MARGVRRGDIDGSPVNGSFYPGHFDPDECADMKERRLADTIELRGILLDWCGEEYLLEMLKLFVFSSTREFDGRGDPCKAHRRKATERPILKRVILLSTFRSARANASGIQAYVDMCRAESMAETALSSILRSKWATVSPRTARAIGSPDAWAVSIGEGQSRFVSLSADEVSEFIRNQASVLFSEDDAYLTVREQHGLMVLDIVKLIPELDCALSFAKSIGQRQIINVKTQQVVETGNDFS